MTKKLIIVIIALSALMLIAGSVLLFLGKRSATKTTPVEAVKQPEIKKLVDSPVISPISSFDGSAVWYFTQDGHLFRINTDGTGLSEYSLPALSGNLISVAWPLQGSDFIVVASDLSGEIKHYYNSEQKQYTPLAPNLGSFDWLLDSKRIAYIWHSSDNVHNQLTVANADGTGFRVVAEVPWPDLVIKVSPKDNIALLIKAKTEGAINKIYKFDLSTGQYEPVVNEGKNLAVTWLLDGNRFLLSQATVSLSTKIFLFNLNAKTQVDLNLNTGLDKVAVDEAGKFLYAAVPKNGAAGDVFWKIDLSNFRQEKYFEPPGDISAKNLFLVKNVLYFINARDGKLYYILR